MDIVRMVSLVRKIVAANIVSIGPAKGDKAVGPAKQEKKESDAADPSAALYRTLRESFGLLSL